MSTCSAGFKAFPIIQQKQCNDNYDVCIHGCPARGGVQVAGTLSVTDRLKELDRLLKNGSLTQAEYDVKRKQILGAL